MAGIGAFINKNPKLGWALALGIAAVAVFMFVRNSRSSETEQLSADVTIRCSETGKEWTVSRGVIEKELYLRPYPVNQGEGLINPDTGKPTGFPVDDWKATVSRINAERKTLAEGGGASTPVKPAPAR